jgi:dTDP-4-dehydrorhamnose reductase
MRELYVTGANGQLGRALLRHAAAVNLDAEGVDLDRVDITNREQVRAAIRTANPRIVINCAAYTDVDGCESHRELALRVNGEAAGHLARACREVGATLVHLSTDFVFDGQKRTPYLETDAPNPLSVYGESKLLGEQAVRQAGLEHWYVLRTQWLFGNEGKNFPRAILARAQAGEPLQVVDDQTGRPTYAEDLAVALFALGGLGGGRRPAESGIYHAANQGVCSWFQFAKHVLAAFGLERTEVAPMASSALARPARRPAYSALDCTKLERGLGAPLPPYQDALRRFAKSCRQDTGHGSR